MFVRFVLLISRWYGVSGQSLGFSGQDARLIRLAKVDALLAKVDALLVKVNALLVKVNALLVKVGAKVVKVESWVQKSKKASQS